MKQRMEITFETEETILIRQATPDEKVLCPMCRMLIEAKTISPITTAEPPCEQIQDMRGNYEEVRD